MAQREFDNPCSALLRQRVRADDRSIKMFRGDAGEDFVVIACDHGPKALPSKSKSACRDRDTFFQVLRNFGILILGCHKRQPPQMWDNLLQNLQPLAGYIDPKEGNSCNVAFRPCEIDYKIVPH